jgi:hypothetical protein
VTHRRRFLGGRSEASPLPPPAVAGILQGSDGRRERVPERRVRGARQRAEAENLPEPSSRAVRFVCIRCPFPVPLPSAWPPSPGRWPPSPSAHYCIASACNRRRRERGSFTASTQETYTCEGGGEGRQHPNVPLQVLTAYLFSLVRDGAPHPRPLSRDGERAAHACSCVAADWRMLVKSTLHSAPCASKCSQASRGGGPSARRLRTLAYTAC